MSRFSSIDAAAYASVTALESAIDPWDGITKLDLLHDLEEK
jgi:hypothetical protein